MGGAGRNEFADSPTQRLGASGLQISLPCGEGPCREFDGGFSILLPMGDSGTHRRCGSPYLGRLWTSAGRMTSGPSMRRGLRAVFGSTRGSPGMGFFLQRQPVRAGTLSIRIG